MAGNELMELASRTFKPGCTVIIKPKRGASVASSFFLLQNLFLSSGHKEAKTLFKKKKPKTLVSQIQLD